MRKRPEHQQVGNKIWKIKEVIQLISCCAIVWHLGTTTCDTAGNTEDLNQKMEQTHSLDQGLLFLSRVLGKQLRGLSKRMLLCWSSSFHGGPFVFSLDLASCCPHCGWDSSSTVNKFTFSFQNKCGHYKSPFFLTRPWHQSLADPSVWTPHEQQSNSHDTNKLYKEGFNTKGSKLDRAF